MPLRIERALWPFMLAATGCLPEVRQDDHTLPDTLSTSSSTDGGGGAGGGQLDPLPDEADGEHHGFVIITALGATLTQMEKGSQCEAATVSAGSDPRPYQPKWDQPGWSCLKAGGFEPPPELAVFDYTFEPKDSTPDHACTAEYCFTMTARWISPAGDDEDIVYGYSQYGKGAMFGISDIIRLK